MILRVGTNTKNLADAKIWVLSPGVSDTLSCLTTWAVSKEPQWGDCVLFFEVSCHRRPTERGSQVDLLLAFKDRIAVCEVKKGPMPDTKKLTDFAAQVSRQADLIRQRLREGRCNLAEKPAALLFFPDLTEPQLKEINRTLNKEGFPHVRPAGCLETPSVSELDLTTSINRWLKDSQLGSGSESVRLSHLIRRQVVSSTNERVTSLEQLLESLRNFVAPTQSLRQPFWHIRSLREAEEREAASILRKSRFLEVVGSEGLGKSAFIKDLFAHDIGNDPREVALAHCYSEHEVARRLHSAMVGESTPSVGEHELIGGIKGSDASLWVSSCDMFSRASLRAVLVNLIGDSSETASDRSRIVVESRVSLEIDHLPSIVLEPLANDAIAAVVRGAPWQKRHELHQIVSAAVGNPALALSMSRSEFVGDQVPLQESKHDRFAPWFVLLDLALDDLEAGMVLARQELGAQAVFLAVQASRKVLESILVARGEVIAVAGEKALAALVKEVKRPHAAEEDWDYLGSHAIEIAEELDRWTGPSGELARYPGGAIVSLKDLVERHPVVSFYPYIAVEAVMRAARLVNWGQFWFRSQAPWVVEFRGRHVCELCEPGTQQPRRPMYICGICAIWVCESCSLLFNLSKEDPAYQERICDHCHNMLAEPEDYSKLDAIIDELRKEGRLPPPNVDWVPDNAE